MQCPKSIACYKDYTLVRVNTVDLLLIASYVSHTDYGCMAVPPEMLIKLMNDQTIVLVAS